MPVTCMARFLSGYSVAEASRADAKPNIVGTVLFERLVDVTVDEIAQVCGGFPSFWRDVGHDRNHAAVPLTLGFVSGQSSPRLYDRIIKVLRVRHYSRRTRSL
jgi:hypothetical protein